VREFRPKVVYPYHYSSSDVNRFKQIVGQGCPRRGPFAQVVMSLQICNASEMTR
jgi:hypothetical protein